MLKPLITEKTLSEVQSRNCYTFLVSAHVTKDQIREYVEGIFGVKVLGVHTSVVRGKKKRLGKKKMLVSKRDFKKVVVRLPEKEKIDLFEIEEKKKGKKGKKS
ncbi:MAG: 50S ribosomal protein L23 [Candidatus Blackburnbacteria bacterium]|nr:50S ribosomal protein L23 [Candidatus Blackburnbacteria bacterium]